MNLVVVLLEKVTYFCTPGLLGAVFDHCTEPSCVAEVGDAWVVGVIKKSTNLGGGEWEWGENKVISHLDFFLLLIIKPVFKKKSKFMMVMNFQIHVQTLG